MWERTVGTMRHAVGRDLILVVSTFSCMNREREFFSVTVITTSAF